MKPSESDILDRFGVRLRMRRMELGLTQEKLAHSIGIDRTYISGLERGSRNPTLLVLERVASGLGTTVGQLLADIT